MNRKKGTDLYAYLESKFGGKPGRDQMGNYWKLPGDDPLGSDYAATDAIATHQLYHKQMLEIGAQELDKVFALENDVIWVLFEMERRGIRVDEAALDESIRHAESMVERAYEAMPPGFNPRSGKQVHDYVRDFKTDWPTTAKGNPSFKEDWLKTFPEGQNIVRVRQWEKTLNDYLLSWRDEHLFNGRIHANFHQNRADDHGTVSGRLSCSDPNLLAVTKHNKEVALVIRRCLVADEGRRMGEADFSQCEPRLFAHYSGDQNLVEGYRKDPPQDVHTLVAEYFQADRATTAKRMNMGMFTGMGIPAFAGHMGIDAQEARRMWNGWHSLFPGIKKFQDRATAVMLARGHVKTLLGRRGRLADRRYAYKAVSRIIQGGNADIIKHVLVRIAREEPRVHLLLSTYDSVTFQYPDDVVDSHAKEVVLDIMNDVQKAPFFLKVPFSVDIGTGNNWAEASL